MIDVPPPFMKSSFDIEFMSFGIDNGMENRMLENQSWTISVRIIVRDEDLEPKNGLLINALTNENDAKPTCNVKT